MLGQDGSAGAIGAVAAPHLPQGQPRDVVRVVESSAKATLQRQQTRSATAPAPNAAQRLSSSARQFADVLDTTGSVQVASSVSGFRIGALDLYA
jgi:hypothetical protein